MDITAIFFLLVVLAAVAFFVSRPFTQDRRDQVVSHEEQHFSALLAERDRLITALQELDFDNALGKVPADDYPVTRAGLMRSAADVLRQLDAFQAQQNAAAGDIDDRIEAVIAARRADAAVGQAAPHTTSASAASDDDLENLIAARKASRKEKSAGFCTQCGKAVQLSDRFCPHCGKRLA